YQHTRGSLLIATAFHASANTWTTVLQIPSTSATFTWLMVASELVVVGIILIVSWCSRRSSTAGLRPATAHPIAVVLALAIVASLFAGSATVSAESAPSAEFAVIDRYVDEQ